MRKKKNLKLISSLVLFFCMYMLFYIYIWCVCVVCMYYKIKNNNNNIYSFKTLKKKNNLHNFLLL